MKARPLIMILGAALLAFSAGTSATGMKRAPLAAQNVQLVSSDRNLNTVIQERIASRGVRNAPSAICATDGSVWSCAPGNALRGERVINVDGGTIQNRLTFGRLETTNTPCMCERADDDSPWVCNPPGCMGTVDMGGRAIDTRTTPQDRLTTPQDRLTAPPRDIQRQGGDRRPPRPGI